MTDQPGAGKSFGMSGDAKERHLTGIRRMTLSPPPARSSTRVWLAAAGCLAALALVGGVLAWRWAAAPRDVENFTVRCQFSGASKVIQTTTLLSPQDATRACGEAQRPGQGITLAEGQLPINCVEASTRIVVLDGSGACPTGSTRD